MGPPECSGLMPGTAGGFDRYNKTDCSAAIWTQRKGEGFNINTDEATDSFGSGKSIETYINGTDNEIINTSRMNMTRLNALLV